MPVARLVSFLILRPPSPALTAIAPSIVRPLAETRRAAKEAGPSAAYLSHFSPSLSHPSERGHACRNTAGSQRG
eukprot:1145504-Pelagomonas_calceolata.AAC.1